MDATTRYRATIIAETCTECFSEHGTHSVGCSKHQDLLDCGHPDQGLIECAVCVANPHANCRQRPCPYCKSILKSIDEADEPETDDRYFGFGDL